jgi:hypothetical protein
MNVTPTAHIHCGRDLIARCGSSIKQRILFFLSQLAVPVRLRWPAEPLGVHSAHQVGLFTKVTRR